MGTPSPSFRYLAERLVALEAASRAADGAQAPEAVRVCEKLQIALTRFAGPDGFASLLRRALALARAEGIAPPTDTLAPDGALQGCEALAVEATNGRPDAAVAIVAHLLGLLETFIGEPLTLRLVREAWPDVTLGGNDSGTEATS